MRLAWLLVIVWAEIIFLLSAVPSLASPFGPWYDFVLRKIAHVGEYAFLTVLLLDAFRASGVERKRAFFYAGVSAFLYALSDEWHQTFVPGREGSLRDVGIDALGVAAVIYSFVRARSRTA